MKYITRLFILLSLVLLAFNVTPAPVFGQNEGVFNYSIVTPSSDAVMMQLSAPTLRYPDNFIVTQNSTIVFDWNNVSGATGYQIQVARDNGFVNLVLDSGTGWESMFVYDFTTNGRYYWRVRALGGNWSVIRQFDVLLRFVLISPQSGRS